MDTEKIFSLIDKAEATSFDRIEIQAQDLRICLERNRCAAPSSPAPARESAPPEEAGLEDVIRAPISGVFYAAREPGAEPYVREGSLVRKGESICIIEAMKMMNEICAPKPGVIARVCLENAQAVSENDALFVYARED